MAIWLANHRPTCLSQLNPGASEVEVSSFRERFPGDMLNDFCAYLGEHDGQPPESETLYDNKRLMPIREILRAVDIFNEGKQSGEFDEENYWQETWVPFVADGGGNHLVLDAQTGFVHEFWKSDFDRPKIANSFSDWMDQLIQMFSSTSWKLERNAYVRTSDAKPADPYEKVSVVFLRTPSGGLTTLKVVYDQLALSYGIGKLLTDLKAGPVTLFSDIYYMDACRLLSRIEAKTDFEIRSDQKNGQTYPIHDAW